MSERFSKTGEFQRKDAKAQRLEEYFGPVCPSHQKVSVGFEGNFDSCPLRLGVFPLKSELNRFGSVNGVDDR
jgi:hypothetical protein